MTALDAHDVSLHYGAVRALEGVSLKVDSEEILGLVGPNGSGKTTLLNAMSGLAVPTRGTVWLDDTDLTGRDSTAFARAGIARTFQTVRLFDRFTTWENLEVAARATTTRNRDTHIASLVERFNLQGVTRTPVGNLPYGTRRRISVARAMARRPRFVLLDEPAAGMNESESLELGQLVRGLHEDPDFHPGILIVDHDMTLITQLCDRVVVLAEGREIASGSGAEVAANPLVRAAFLGSTSGLEVEG